MRSMHDLDLQRGGRARPGLRRGPLCAALALAVTCATGPATTSDGDGVASAAQASTAAQAPMQFDGERALEHVRTLVEMGPRPAGSEALEEARLYIEATLEGHGLVVRRDEFVAQTPLGEIPMANLVAEVEPQDGAGDLPTVMIAGHYDTKLFEGFEFVGANDGGSSTGLLLELGRVLSTEPPPLPVWLVFFDGEEALVRWTDDDSVYGSRHLVARLAREERLRDIGALVLVDMVGDEDLGIVRDGYSTGWLVDLFWETAASLGHGDHFGTRVSFIDDDHVPFLEAGVPSIDLIDFDYGPGNRYWHSPFDTMEQLSADSLEMVGQVVLAALPALRDRFRNR